MRAPCLTLAIVFTCATAFSQKPRTITLEGQKLDTGPLNYRITRVVDTRSVKSNIGWLQTGMANKKRFAVFSRPAEEELMNLISANYAPGGGQKEIVLSIKHLAISEETRAMSETARTELTVDLFLVSGDSAWFLGRKNEVRQSGGMDVTHQHPRNIAGALSDALKHFNSILLQPVGPAFSAGEIETFRPASESDPLLAPVFTATSHPDGLFASFEEFRDNTPSITDGYIVDEGRNIKAHWDDTDKGRKRIKEGVYGMAHKGELYIFVNNFFYLVEKRTDGFYFEGPSEVDTGAVVAGGLLGGAIGGGLAAAATSHRTAYYIDLANGSLKPTVP